MKMMWLIAPMFWGLKIAVTCWFAVSGGRMQVELIPLQAPSHPTKLELGCGVAVSVT